jgi:hypothetical protein
MPTTIAGRSGAAPGRPMTRTPSTSCRSPGSRGKPSTRPPATTTRPIRSSAGAAVLERHATHPQPSTGQESPALPMTTVRTTASVGRAAGGAVDGLATVLS